MLLSPGPSCPDPPSFEELSAVEIDSQIHEVLDPRVNPNLGACHTQFCKQNQVLITGVPKIIYATDTDIKCS
jgi:hypothetical protein